MTHASFARTSQLFIRTLREDPKDAEIPSHRLLARTGYIWKLAAGIYSYGPLMVRVIRKVEAILREELEKRGATEIWMPVLQPRELWEESERWEAYTADGLLFHLKDRKEGELLLGPTHEEVVTDIARRSIRSYKELPVILYQQQTKFRDEIRPRFGLMRGREFLMKDAYSFDRDPAGLDRSYQAMRDAYAAAFSRMGLDFIIVEADPGAIGGSGSEEFMVKAGTGEDAIISCPSCRYAANVEKARSVAPPSPASEKDVTWRAMHIEPTPNVRTVAELERFFDMPSSRMVKTLIYRVAYADRVAYVAALLRGDTELHETKLRNATGGLAVTLASEEEIRKVTGAPQGFAGPIGLEIPILADLEVEPLSGFLCGANKADAHALDVCYGRDFPAPRFKDLRRAMAGEACVRCGAALQESRGIEVGHVFKLGTKYSESMKATFADEDGREKPFVMGCYGIGITRVAQAAIEQTHDEKGMVWPLPIAPFEVIVIVPGAKDAAARATGEKLAEELSVKGVEVLLEDREMSAGQMFKDAELLGLPFQVVSGKLVKEGKVELVTRRDGAREQVPVAELPKLLAARIEALRRPT